MTILLAVLAVLVVATVVITLTVWAARWVIDVSLSSDGGFWFALFCALFIVIVLTGTAGTFASTIWVASLILR